MKDFFCKCDQIRSFQQLQTYKQKTKCVKSVRIWSFSSSYFPAFGLNTERCGVSLRVQSECRKMRTRETPNTDTFHGVHIAANLWINI